MTDAQQLAKTSEEMGIRKLAVALFSAVEGLAQAKGETDLSKVGLNFVQIELIVQGELAKLNAAAPPV
jgi:hypothetical protein